MFQLSNLENELALKAILWSPAKGKFVSLADLDFAWDDDGLVSAGCKHNPEPHKIEGCYCGIYGTWRLSILPGYQAGQIERPVLMIEAAGDTVLYEHGFRSEQACVRAVVNGLGAPPMITRQAADFFNVPILPYDVALTVIDIWNWWLNAWYIPETTIVADKGRVAIVNMVAQELGKSPMEALWQVSPQYEENK